MRTARTGQGVARAATVGAPSTATAAIEPRRPGVSWWRWPSLVGAALFLAAAYHVPAAPVAPAPAVTPAAPAATVPLLPSEPVELALRPFLGEVKTIAAGGAPASLPYIFDTGGGLTVVTPEEARRLGCEPFGLLTGFRASGERLDMPRCGPVRLQLGGQVVEDEAGVLDVNALIGPGAPKVGGIVALQTLHGRAFTLDYAHNRVILESAASLARRIKTLRAMEVRPEMQAGGATLDLFVAVDTPKGKIWLELDSGNTGPVHLAPHAMAQLGLTPAALAHGKIDLDFAGLGRIAVTAAQKDCIYDGLLNADTIAALTLTIDLRSLRMWGAPAAAPPASGG